MTTRRFPPPWTVIEHAESFWVQDAGGQMSSEEARAWLKQEGPNPRGKCEGWGQHQGQLPADPSAAFQAGCIPTAAPPRQGFFVCARTGPSRNRRQATGTRKVSIAVRLPILIAFA
jgi:hypothetical protein